MGLLRHDIVRPGMSGHSLEVFFFLRSQIIKIIEVRANSEQIWIS